MTDAPTLSPLDPQPLRRSAWVIVVIAILASMGRLVVCEFTSWDDWFTILFNPHINPPSWSGLAFHWTHFSNELYDPIAYTVWSAIAVFARLRDVTTAETLNPWIFHGANLLVHIGSALIVMRILRQLGFGGASACVGALVFALHPVQVETVGWLSGMKDLLAGFFAFAAIDRYLAGRAGKRPHLFAAAGCFVLAVMSKPSAIVVPGVLFVIEWVYYQRSFRAAIASVLPFFLLAIPFLIIGAMAQVPYAPHGPIWWKRPLVAGHALAFYLGKLVWPLHLTLDYGQTPDVVTAPGGDGWWAWIIPVTVAIAVWLWPASQRRRGMRCGLLVALVAISPVLGFISFVFQDKSTVADHYLYEPMLGVAIVAAAITEGRALWRYLAAIAIAALAVQSFRQAATWQNDQTLFEHAVEVNPQSWSAHTNLFILYGHLNDPDRALYHARLAEQIHPDWVFAHVHMGQALEGLNDLAGARREYLEAVTRYPEAIEAHLAMAQFDAKTGNLEGAKTELAKAARIDATNPGVTDVAQKLRETERRATNPGQSSQPSTSSQ